MTQITWSLLFIAIFTKFSIAAPLYNQDGIKLNHTLIKKEVVFVPAMNKDIVIWKSTFELVNSSKKAIAVRIPCYLCYAYSYLSPLEISTVQNYVSDITLSDVYKNYVTEKPQMVNAKQTITSEKYFATLDNVDLRTATMNWDFKFSFWK